MQGFFIWMRDIASIAAGNEYPTFAGLACYHVNTRCLLEGKGDTTDRGLCLFLDSGFGLGSAIPVTEEEAAVFDTLLELLIVVTNLDVCIAELACLLKDVVLNLVEQRFHTLYNAVETYRLFL